MAATRLAMVALLLLPALAFGQGPGKEDESGKVSNDQPGRPLQMPPASTETKEALDDFERFQRRGAWERALKALYTIRDDQALRFVDGENGFIIPVARKRRSALAALPAEGQAAYRLFYDAEAKKLLEKAVGADELKTLESLYSAYFLTSVGDDAADRLGDLYYEAGRFDRAADCWLAIVRERPDTDLSPALVSVKAALALAHAGRRSELEQLRSELADRYADERPTLGGQSAPPAELLRRLLADDDPTEAAPSATSPDATGPDLAGEVDPAWQVRFAESVEAGMAAPELLQWESNPLSAAVPATTVDGTSLFANYLGYAFALDLPSGKMLWRSASFHHLEVAAMQDQARAIDATRFAIVASGDYLWCLGRDLKEQNYFAPFQLTCRRASGGDVVWKSPDLPDYAQLDLVGPPLLAGGKLFLTAKTHAQPGMQQRPPQHFVMAVQPHDGKVLWKTEVGSSRQAQQYYSYYSMRDPSPKPQLIYRAGAVYVDTHVGVLGRLDADSGSLDWGYGYPTDHVQSSRFFFIWDYYQPRDPATASSPPLPAGEALLIKGMQSTKLFALEPNRLGVLWDRPIAKSSRLLAADDRAVYLGGPEIGALDLKTRALKWATRLPGGSAECRVLVRPDGIWQLTPRGVFELDPATGTVRRIFRGKDLGSAGGDLILTDRWLLTVSNRTISAYPRRPAVGEAGARKDSPDTKAEGSE